jgi:adenylate cyclase
VTNEAAALAPVAPASTLDRLTLRFRDQELERRYQHDAVAGVHREVRGGTSASVGLWLVAGLIIPATTDIPASLSTPVVLAMVVVNLLAFALVRRTTTLDGAVGVLVGTNVVTGMAVIGLAFRSSEFDRYAGPAVMLQATFAFLIARRFVLTVLAGSIEVGLLIAAAAARGLLSGYILDLFIVVSAVSVGIAFTYVIESAARTGWYQRMLIDAQRLELSVEKAKSDRLLRNVLPDAIADRLRERDATIADGVDDATVLFADLAGFTPLAGRLSPADVVGMLDALFREFDEITDRFGLEKIKTIGDAYMAAGGVPEPIPDHARQVVRAGLAMVTATRAYAASSGMPVELRVGVHTGPLVAGVIGRRRFSYDLWGDTVNTASRMESHGVADALQVSRATRDRLGSDFDITPRGSIDVKGKGGLEVFLVAEASSDAAARP